MRTALRNPLKKLADQVGMGLRTIAKPTMLTLSLMSLCVLWSLHVGWVQAADAPYDANVEKAEMTPDFHKQSNEELLKQSESIFRASLESFRAEVRGLAKSELILKQAETAREAFHMPDDIAEQTVRLEEETLETKKAQAEQAKARHDAWLKQVELIQAEKKGLETHIEHIEQARLAAESFNATIGQLELSLLEVRLRIADGTLASDKVSALLQEDELEVQHQALRQQLETLNELSQAAPIKLKLVLTRLEEAEKQELEADVQKVSAEKQYREELKRQELLQEYSEQTPKALSEKLPDLQEELVGLNGALQLAHRGFQRRQAEVAQLQKEIDALSTPESAEQIQFGVAVRADEVERRSEQTDQVITYHDQRLEKTQALHTALTALIKEGEIYKGDATVLNLHVFDIQVPVGILERAVLDGQAQADVIPEGAGSEALSVMKEKAEAAAEDALSAIEQSKGLLVETSKQIEKTQAARQEAESYLKQLQQQAKAAEEARRWAAELKDLTAEQVVERFKATTQELSANAETAQNARKVFDEAKKHTEEEQIKFESLTDPLLRSAQQEAAAEEHTIIKKLYALAEIEPPAELKTAEPTEVVAHSAEGQPDNTAQYQNLLATRERIIQEREEQQGNLKEALNEYKLKIEEYEKHLSEEDGLLQQQYRNAIELKKRIGLGQLADDAIPEGITDALNSKRIESLEKDMAALLHDADAVQQQADNLDGPDENLEEIRTSLETTITAVGKRLDMASDLEKLQKSIQRTAADRSKVEVATLEQNATRRLRADESREEQIFAYVPSEQADEMTDLLKVYCQELLDLESQRANLQSQSALTERMIELAESEKGAVAALLPLFQKQEELLRMAEDETWVTIEAGLAPEKAADFISAHETKTGVLLPTPPPVAPDEKPAAIAAGAELLFARYADVVAAQKWTSLFERRLSEAGLDSEIGAYQDQLGAIEAQAAALQRAMHRLTGHPAEELEKLDEADAPKTAAEREQYLRGEIGALRADRHQTRRQAIIEILTRLAIIAVAAVILTLITSFVLNRMSKRYRNPGVSGNAQTLLVLSFMKTLAKMSIWVTAFILILSTLGFNVGAILAGLGIGGLAIAMAARETLSDMLGGIMIFIERPFVIGDTVQIAGGATTKVIDMTWRTTRLSDAFDYHYTVPNRQVANATIQNYTQMKPIRDFISIFVSPEYNPDKVIATVNEALESCEAIMQDQAKDTMLAGVKTIGYQTVMEFWPWWYTSDYHLRSATRAAVWHSIWTHLNNSGIKLEVNSFESRNADEGPMDMKLIAGGES